MAKHALTGRHVFEDRRKDQYRNRKNDRIRARHRVEGPLQAPTLYDMTSDELTDSKGAGPRY